MSFAEIQITRVKEYWDQRPCNIRHSPKPVGTEEFFGEVEARKYYLESQIPSFAEYERLRGKKVLEIGCGIGSTRLAASLSSALEVWAKRTLRGWK